MDERPEVIDERIQETRTALAEKLDKLTGKLAGTVETVENTVENVAHTVENVSETVSSTVENVSETVTEATEGTVHAIQDVFNLKQHAHNHPWLLFGGAMLIGYVGGRLLMAPSPQRYTGLHGAGWNYFPPPQYEAGAGYRSTERAGEPQAAEMTQPSAGLFGGIIERFGPELNTLKGLALGALFGVTRDMLTRSLPEAIQGQVRGVFDSATEKVGGQPIDADLTQTSEPSGAPA